MTQLLGRCWGSRTPPEGASSCGNWEDDALCLLRKGTLYTNLKLIYWDFPGSPVVKTDASHAGDMGLIPGQGTKIPQATGIGNEQITLLLKMTFFFLQKVHSLTTETRFGLLY